MISVSAKHRFVCLMHSKTKQYQMLEFGAEKDLLKAMQVDGWLMP